MWRGKTVSVIFPTYNEKDSIYRSIQDFFETGFVDEIVVVNNNAAVGTAEEVGRTRARQVFEARQGYGYALRRGMAEATGDLIVWAEPDGTFVGKDVERLLVYTDDFSVVFGTRTCTSLIGSGANMGMFLRYGNVFVAKLLEALFNTYTLTDVGCTMRVARREAIETMRPHFHFGSSFFGLEFMVHTIMSGYEFVQIPVTYRERVGESSVTGDFGKAFSLGIQMIVYVVWAWCVYWLRRMAGRRERRGAQHA